MIVSSTRFVRELQKKMNETKIFTLQNGHLHFFLIIYKMTKLVYTDKLRIVYNTFLSKLRQRSNWGFAASCKEQYGT